MGDMTSPLLADSFFADDLDWTIGSTRGEAKAKTKGASGIRRLHSSAVLESAPGPSGLQSVADANQSVPRASPSSPPHQSSLKAEATFDREWNIDATTWDLQHLQPGKWEVSPAKWQVSPAKWQVSPAKWQVSPAKWQVSPAKWQVARNMTADGDSRVRFVEGAIEAGDDRERQCLWVGAVFTKYGDSSDADEAPDANKNKESEGTKTKTDSGNPNTTKPQLQDDRRRRGATCGARCGCQGTRVDY
jgi:hypothetical protein